MRVVGAVVATTAFEEEEEVGWSVVGVFAGFTVE